jgi:DtxR family Mn-dependent transcriptional regulator
MTEHQREALSPAQEDYLKQIFLIDRTGCAASTQILADRLGVRPPSVTGMLKRLAQQGFIEHEPYRGARLTAEGRRAAMELVRHHRLLETFLHEMLGFPWDEVHEEAERLEHVISEEFERRIALALGDPTHDPHGDPIPTSDLDFPEEVPTIPLTEAAPGTEVRLARVHIQDRDSLNLLARVGLLPGTAVRVVEVNESGVRLDDGGDRILLPRSLAVGLAVIVT